MQTPNKIAGTQLVAALFFFFALSDLMEALKNKAKATAEKQGD